MTRPQDPGDEARPSWMGAPGYQPHPEAAPHAPMPGAPPYPPHEERPAPPVGRPRTGTRFVRALGAAAVWAGVNLLLILLTLGPPPDARAAGSVTGSLVIAVALTALVTWLVARRRTWSFWVLLAVSAPVYFVVRGVPVLLAVLAAAPV